MPMPQQIEGEDYMTQGEVMERLNVKDRKVFSDKMDEAGISWVQFPFLDKRKKFYKVSVVERLIREHVEKQGKRTYAKKDTNHS